ncbi:hypothetical protein BGZ65_009032, partial [Modicella reniformis]
MGVPHLFGLIQKKGYDPQVAPMPLANPAGRVLIDLLGSLYITIRQSYSSNPPLKAQFMVLTELSRLVQPSNALIYIDGERASEKMDTHAKRDETRFKALQKADASIGRFQQRADNGLRIRKQHHIDIQKHLRNAFEWPAESRNALAAFLRDKGWTVKQCALEADVEIARDCTEVDVVLTRDSDALVYQNVPIVWRLISRRRVLVYNMNEVLVTLGVSRQQLTTLGVVSQNDYTSNVPSLGCATNFDIVKQLKATAVRALVREYLSCPKVLGKNTEHNTFEASLQVFVDLEQTPAPPTQLSDNADIPPSYASLCAKYRGICENQRIVIGQQRLLRQSTSTVPSFYIAGGSTKNQFRPIFQNKKSILAGTWYADVTQAKPRQCDPPRPPSHPTSITPKKKAKKKKKKKKCNGKKKQGGASRTVRNIPSATGIDREFRRKHPVKTLTVGSAAAGMKRQGVDQDAARAMQRQLGVGVNLANQLQLRAYYACAIFITHVLSPPPSSAPSHPSMDVDDAEDTEERQRRKTLLDHVIESQAFIFALGRYLYL